MSTYKEHIKPVVVLLAICLVVSAMLAGTFALTDPIITAAEQEKSERLRREILPDAVSFELVETDKTGIVSVYKDTGGTGWIVTAQTSGYGGSFNVTIGIAPDGAIIKVSVGTNSETVGVGSRATLPDYTDRFTGQHSPDAVDALTGATVTSRAIKSAIANATELYNDVLKEGK